MLEHIAAFCTILRQRHQFKLGVGEIEAALVAIERLGVHEPRTVQSALRAVCCSKLEDIELFDAAFLEFFFPQRQGTPQPRLPSESRVVQDNKKPAQQPNIEPRDKPSQDNPEADQNFIGQNPKHNPSDQDEHATPSQKIMRGFFSAVSLEPSIAKINPDHLEPMLLAAATLVRNLRLGRSRKWRTQKSGSRFDFRRTLRRSLGTGGEALQAFWLGHPKRNPRIVLLLDGSRSMLESTAPMLQFAYALTQRSRRVDVFTFSTALQDVTHRLRERKLELQSAVGTWGGGTKIGECLRQFLSEHGSRVLNPDTLVIISSDGLDVGEMSHLEYAMRELKRRSFAVLWLNPLAAHPDFAPTSRGMKTALPFISHLGFARSADEFSSLAEWV